MIRQRRYVVTPPEEESRVCVLCLLSAKCVKCVTDYFDQLQQQKPANVMSLAVLSKQTNVNIETTCRLVLVPFSSIELP